jgi:hypothetical protein
MQTLKRAPFNLLFVYTKCMRERIFCGHKVKMCTQSDAYCGHKVKMCTQSEVVSYCGHKVKMCTQSDAYCGHKVKMCTQNRAKNAQKQAFLHRLAKNPLFLLNFIQE